MRRSNILIVGLVSIISGSWLAGQLLSADPKPNSSEELNRISGQIAAMSVKLAEVELQVLVDANEKLANTFPRSAVARLRQTVAAAKLQAANATKSDSASLHENYVALTGAEMHAAALEYQTALAANKSVKNAVPPLELERLKIMAELAKLRNERAQQSTGASEMDLLNWQIADLRDHVRRLSQQVELYRGNE
jgi:hypothetical protein